MTFAWVLAASGLMYVAYQLKTGNYRQVLFTRRDAPDVWPTIRHYLARAPRPCTGGRTTRSKSRLYGRDWSWPGVGRHRCRAYKPVQLSWLVTWLGGFRLTRVWHFAATCGLLAFIPGHVFMVALHGWRNFASMWTGSKTPSNPLTDAVRS